MEAHRNTRLHTWFPQKTMAKKQVGYCLGEMGNFLPIMRMIKGITAANMGLEAQGLHLYTHQVSLAHWYFCSHC